MADKVQLIKEEIEKQIDYAEDDTRYTESYREGLIAAYQTIKAFIDSLPEGLGCKKDYRERYKRIVQTEQFKKSYCDKSLGKEEPVSEDLEEELHSWMRENCDDNGFFNQLELAHHFAEWQKQQMMKDVVNGIMDCDDDNEWIEITDKLIVTPSSAGNRVKIIIVKEEQE